MCNMCDQHQLASSVNLFFCCLACPVKKNFRSSSQVQVINVTKSKRTFDKWTNSTLRLLPTWQFDHTKHMGIKLQVNKHASVKPYKIKYNVNRIVPSKCPLPSKHPPPDFDSFVTFWGPPCNCPPCWILVESKSTGANVHSCDHPDVLQAQWHLASSFCAYLSMALFAAFFACSTKFAYYKRRTLRKVGNEATSRSAFRVGWIMLAYFGNNRYQKALSIMWESFWA